MSVPLLKYINAVDQEISIEHGTMPNVPYQRTPGYIISKKDPEVDLVLKMAAGNSI